jgi:hypothetical protein
MKGRVQGRSADSASTSAIDKGSKALSMPAVPVLQPKKEAVGDDKTTTPAQLFKSAAGNRPFQLAGAAEQDINRPGRSLQMQPFQLKNDTVQKADATNQGTAQLKKVWYRRAAQKAAEGSTHHGKTIHYLTKHGSGVTDGFQENRLLGQERAFDIVRTALVAESTASIPGLEASVTELTASAARMGPAHAKYVSTQKRLDLATATLATTRAKIVALSAIVPGSTEMFVEMGGTKRKEYAKELRKPENFGAGTPTKVVTNFAENETTMLSIPEQVVDVKRGDLEEVVGEAGKKPEGIITTQATINADFRKHTLTGPATVVHETVQGEAKTAFFSFVAQEVPGVLPANVPAPVTLFVESGYIQP